MWLEVATLSALNRALSSGQFHIFHYVGHAGFDIASSEGHLVLEGPGGGPHEISGSDMGNILCDHRSLRLVVLNACEGARTSTEDPFSGVATCLIEREIPAVVAMQFEITDDAALVFADAFYGALVDRGEPVDIAVSQARKEIYANDPAGLEWGTPVLFVRVPNAKLFDFGAQNARAKGEPAGVERAGDRSLGGRAAEGRRASGPTAEGRAVGRRAAGDRSLGGRAAEGRRASGPAAGGRPAIRGAGQRRTAEDQAAGGIRHRSCPCATDRRFGRRPPRAGDQLFPRSARDRRCHERRRALGRGRWGGSDADGMELGDRRAGPPVVVAFPSPRCRPQPRREPGRSGQRKRLLGLSGPSRACRLHC